MSEQTIEKSEFNMAVSYLNRLNTLLYAANDAAVQVDVEMWFHILLALYRELSTHMTETDLKDWRKKIQEINNSVGIFKNTYQNTGSANVDSSLYDQFMDFEIFLRKVIFNSGLETRMQDEASKALK